MKTEIGDIERRMDILEAEMDDMENVVKNMKKIIAAIEELREVVALQHPTLPLASLFWVGL